MIVQGVTLNGITVFDSSPVTSGLMYAIAAGDTASYSGSGTSINNLANTLLLSGGIRRVTPTQKLHRTFCTINYDLIFESAKNPPSAGFSLYRQKSMPC